MRSRRNWSRLTASRRRLRAAEENVACGLPLNERSSHDDMPRLGFRFGAASLLFCLAFVFAWSIANGQEPMTTPDELMVEWNFPPQTEVRKLIDFAADQLDFGVLYDEQINSVRVTIRTPDQVPRSSILPLLETALRMKDLALVDAEIPGWKRVVSVAGLAAATGVAGGAVAGERRPSSPVTEIIRLENLDALSVAMSLRGFLTSPGDRPANSNAMQQGDSQLQVLTGPNALIVTDFAQNVDRFKTVIAWLDGNREDETVQFIQLKRASSEVVADAIVKVISGGKKRVVSAAGGGGASREVRVVQDNLSNQLILIGSKEKVEALAEFVEKLDVEDSMSIRPYRLEFASAERFNELLQTLFDADASTSLKTSVSPGGDSVLVRATARQHDRIAAILKQIDVEKPRDKSRVRFYHLDHTTAFEILATMQALEGDSVGDSGGSGGPAGFLPGGGFFPIGGFSTDLGPGFPAQGSQTGGSRIRSPSNSRMSR